MRDNRDEDSVHEHDVLTIVVVIALLVMVWCFMHLSPAHALPGDDHGNHGNLKAWFDNLSSGKGLCCSFADGSAVKDVDWDTAEVCDGNMQGGSGQSQEKVCQTLYRVRLHGEWIVVPLNAVVTEPNRYGPAVVWTYQDSAGVTQVRCFLSGAGA